MSRVVLLLAACLASGCLTPPIRTLRQHQARGTPLHVRAGPPAPLEPETQAILLNPLGCAAILQGASCADELCAAVILGGLLVCVSTAVAVDAVALPVQLARRHQQAKDNERLLQACSVRDPGSLLAWQLADAISAELGFRLEEASTTVALPAVTDGPDGAVVLRLRTARFARKKALLWEADAALLAPDGEVLWSSRCAHRGAKRHVSAEPSGCDPVVDELRGFADACAGSMMSQLRAAWDADAARAPELPAD
jgi:hypothetical protein